MTRRRARVALLFGGWAVATGVAGAQGTVRVAVVVPRYLTAGGAAAALVAKVTSVTGGPVPDGTPVAFVASLGISVSPPVTTTLGGLAVTRMTPGTEAGFAQLDAVAGTGRGTAIMWVRPAPAAQVVGLEAVPRQVSPGGRAAVTGAVVDAYGNRAEGDVARWEAGGGTIASPSLRVDHGQVRADFVAGADVGDAWVRLTVGDAAGGVTIPVVADGPRLPPQPLWLPLTLGNERRAGACEDVLVNGSFERWDPGATMPYAWCEEAYPSLCPARVIALDGDAAEGTRAVRIPNQTDTGSWGRISQVVSVAPDSRGGRLWLWVRGGSTSGGVNLAVWTTQAVGIGQTPILVPYFIQDVAVPEADWVRLAVPLPPGLGGRTRLDITPYSAPTVDVDGVRLEVCW